MNYLMAPFSWFVIDLKRKSFKYRNKSNIAIPWDIFKKW